MDAIRKPEHAHQAKRSFVAEFLLETFDSEAHMQRFYEVRKPQMLLLYSVLIFSKLACILNLFSLYMMPG